MCTLVKVHRQGLDLDLLLCLSIVPTLAFGVLALWDE